MESAPAQIGYKRIHPRARPPARATAGASGFDLAACLDEALTLEPGRVALIPTGLALAVPRGMEGQVRARSGLALRHGIAVLNGPGTIDSDYRGEVMVLLVNWGSEPFVVAPGDRVGQLVIAPVVVAELEEADELDDTTRGHGGFGHTG